MIDFIVNPFTTVLTFLYSVLGQDMIIAIAVFTVLVRLVTLPLTLQQQKSSQTMSLLQPELKKLQDKYKNDREALAREQMALYRQYGVNPVGGCLPLLIQFPIFIGLYQAIIHALASTPNQMLDLGGRLLIPGLDQFVPLNNMWLGMNLTLPPNISAGGLPMIVGVVLIAGVVLTTWLQFKVTTPKMPPGDDGKPNQAAQMTQSMGTIMPLMYGFFAINFSIGLSIYFIVSNLIGIAQYFLVRRPALMAASGNSGAAALAAPARAEKRENTPARTITPARPTGNGNRNGTRTGSGRANPNTRSRVPASGANGTSRTAVGNGVRKK